MPDSNPSPYPAPVVVEISKTEVLPFNPDDYPARQIETIWVESPLENGLWRRLTGRFLTRNR